MMRGSWQRENLERPHHVKKHGAPAVLVHGLTFNDTTALAEAFWPDARLYFTTRDGQLGQLTQAKWYAGFAGSIGKEEKIVNKIYTAEPR